MPKITKQNLRTANKEIHSALRDRNIIFNGVSLFSSFHAIIYSLDVYVSHHYLGDV